MIGCSEAPSSWSSTFFGSDQRWRPCDFAAAVPLDMAQKAKAPRSSRMPIVHFSCALAERSGRLKGLLRT